MSTSGRGCSRIVYGLIGLGLLAGAAWLIVRGVEKDPALVGSLLTAASAVVAVSVSRTMEKKAELRQVHREHMAPLYAELLERVRTVDQDEAEAEAFWRGLSSRLILYGPPSVIKAQLTLSRYLGQMGSPLVPNREMMELLERLYRAMRADLGHDDKGLDEGDLLRLYITDIDEVIGPFNPGS
jgi:hypothetical protein